MQCNSYACHYNVCAAKPPNEPYFVEEIFLLTNIYLMYVLIKLESTVLYVNEILVLFYFISI